MAIEHIFLGLPVADLAAALAWYERLLGRAPEVRPNDNEEIWHMLPGGSVYVVADAARAGRGLLVVFVDDLDRMRVEAGERGISMPEVESAPGLFRKVTIEDLDGNRIQFAETWKG